MARMIAIRPFPFAGKTRKPGDEFTVTDSRHVRILSLLGKAAIVKPEKPAKKTEPVKKTAKKVEPVKEEPKKVEPKFEIEETEEKEPEPEKEEEKEEDKTEEPVEISPRTGLPKRRYIRRDMESEE